MELFQASRQWSSRPADQRFTNLDDLHGMVTRQRDRSRAIVLPSKRLEVVPVPETNHQGLAVINSGGQFAYTPSHWSFGQLSSLAGAPAAYLRKLPAELAADCLNVGLRVLRDVEDVGILITKDGEAQELRAATGPKYGRIWNHELTGALRKAYGNGIDGRFKVPGEFGKRVEITKENTTLFASDRDMFVFLADEENRVEMKDRRGGKGGSLARGFFLWNSEVGSQSLGAAFFLFDYTCSNRIVWGAENYKEIRLRHTVSAPDRWLQDITPVLNEYANESARGIEETIRRAQEARLGSDLDDFLAKRKFSASEAASVKQAHIREEGRPIETLWDVVTGVTAHAKSIEYQDARINMERAGGKILDLVAA